MNHAVILPVYLLPIKLSLSLLAVDTLHTRIHPHTHTHSGILYTLDPNAVIW